MTPPFDLLEPHDPGTSSLMDDLLRTQAALADEIDSQQKEIYALQQQLTAVTNSLGYRFLNRLWPLRRFLFPPESIREKWLRRTARFIVDARHFNLHEFLLRLRIPNESAPDLTDPATVASVTPILPPRVTVLSLDPRLDGQLRSWCTHQTWPAVDIQTWSKQASDRSSWGRYLCVGSDDLIAQPPTWLETNLLALERENLAFVVNTRGIPIWLTLQLDQGRLPGSNQTPLLRIVARSDCVTADLDIRLREFLHHREQAHPQEYITVGRVINWTTQIVDRFSDLPFYSSITDEPVTDDRSYAALDLPYFSSHPNSYPNSGYSQRMQTLERSGTYLVVTTNEPQPATLTPPAPVHRIFDMPPSPDTRPTVLVFQPFLAMGGAERVALDVMRALAERIRFIVVATDSHDAHLGTTTDRFRSITPYVYTAHDFLPSTESRNFLEYLIARFEPRTLYIANGSTWLLDDLPSLRAAHSSLRILHQVYDHHFGWINHYDARLIAAIDTHIGASEKICTEYARRGVPRTSITQIPHGIDTDEFDPAQYGPRAVHELRRTFGLPVDGKVITFIGRLHAQKRPLDFVEMARQMQSQPDLSFFMVGDGPLAATITEHIHRLQLRNFVLRTFHEPSRDVFAASDLVVLPSQYEGMPLVVLEAQAMGVPIVVTDVGNIQQILSLTNGGIVVKQIGNPDMLRRAVRRALQMKLDVPHVRAQLAEHFGIERVAEQYARALLGEPQEAPA